MKRIISGFQKRIMPPMQETLIALAIFGFALLCAVAGCESDRTGSGYFSQKKFDSKVWKMGDLQVRGEMANNLLLQRDLLLVGKTKSQIEELLGPPDSTNQINEMLVSPGSTRTESWEYDVDLGEKFFSSPWLYFIKIEFDKNGKALNVMLLD